MTADQMLGSIVLPWLRHLDRQAIGIGSNSPEAKAANEELKQRQQAEQQAKALKLYGIAPY